MRRAMSVCEAHPGEAASRGSLELSSSRPLSLATQAGETLRPRTRRRAGQGLRRVPGRRQRARLPRLLRPARGAADGRRPAHQRAAGHGQHALEAAGRRSPRHRARGLDERPVGPPRCSPPSTRPTASRRPRRRPQQRPSSSRSSSPSATATCGPPGMEADDVIGTLSAIAERAGHRVCVVSTDRDAFQLASDNVCIMMTPRGVTDVVVYTPERDPPALRHRPRRSRLHRPQGRHLDNIKGVPGIGDKTAADLPVQFGSWRASTRTSTRWPARSGASRWRDGDRGCRAAQAAGDHRPRARRSTSTSTRWWPPPPDRSTMKELFRKLEFRALLKPAPRAPGGIPAAPAAPVERTRAALGEGTLERHRAAAATRSGRSRDGRAALGAAGRRRAGGDAGAHRRCVLGAGRPSRASPTALHLPGPAAGRRHRRSPPYLSIPAVPATRSPTWPRSRASTAAVQADEETAALVAAARRPSGRLHAGLAERVEQRQMTSLYHDIELPLAPVLADDGGHRRARGHLPPGRDRRQRARPGRRARAARSTSWPAAPFMIGSPKQLGQVLFERLGPAHLPQRQDRVLHRRAGAQAPRHAPDRRRDRGAGASSRSC